MVAAAAETVATAEGAGDTGAAAEETAAGAEGAAEETAAGAAGAGGVAGLASGGALVGAEAVGGAVGGVGAAVGEGASGQSDRLNAGCDGGDCGRNAAAWLLWMPPFSYAWSFPRSGCLSSRPQKRWSSPHSGTDREKSLCQLHCLNGLSDSTGTQVCWRSWSQIGCWR